MPDASIASAGAADKTPDPPPHIADIAQNRTIDLILLLANSLVIIASLSVSFAGILYSGKPDPLTIPGVVFRGIVPQRHPACLKNDAAALPHKKDIRVGSVPACPP
jgi:hypothetical protein